jgi:hypothetical protein
MNLLGIDSCEKFLPELSQKFLKLPSFPPAKPTFVEMAGHIVHDFGPLLFGQLHEKNKSLSEPVCCHLDANGTFHKSS